MADEPNVHAELSRDLSLFHVTMMGLGMMIGAGVFIGIGNSMYVAGPGGLLLTFVLNGLIALFTAMSFAELSSAIPRAGGAYNFARIAFGRGPSFLAGWVEWFASSVAGALYAVVFATYTLDFFAQLGLLEWLPFGLGIARKLVAVGIAALFVYINYRGSSETGKIGAFFTLGQMGFVLAIAVVGIVTAAVDPQRVANFRPFMPRGWGALLASMGVIYVAFEGFEVIAQAGDETVEPRKNIPKAMLYSVFIVTITYVLVAIAAVVAVRPGHPDLAGAQPWEWVGSFRDTGFGRAVARLMPTPFVGYLLVSMAVVFSSTSALNATIYSATRASYALGRDRMLPGAFSKISHKRRTPYVALGFTSLIVLFCATALPIMDVAASASMMFLALFLMVNLCVIKVRLNMGDELQYGFVMPLFPLLPIVAIVCQIALAGGILQESPVAWIVAAVWVPAGIVIYLVYSRTRAVATEEEIHVFEQAEAPRDSRRPVRAAHRVMVSVANPGNALALVRQTYRLCEAREARVELLHMVPVPSQVPLADADRYMLEGREGILETMLYLAPQFPVNTHLRYCRNVARGIVSAVREKRIDTLILGWHGRIPRGVFRLGSTIDPVIERSPCNVVVFKGCGGDQVFRRVLVPVAGGPNGAYALETASILAADDGRVTAFTVRRRTGDGFDLDAFAAEQAKRLKLPAGRMETKAVEARRVVDAILEEAEQGDYDLVVLGCTEQPLLRQLAQTTVPEAVARRCDRPLVMAKAATGIRSWLRRWI